MDKSGTSCTIDQFQCIGFIWCYKAQKGQDKKKDYIENPKENGYRSLHLIVSAPIFLSNEKRNVKVEIQFRTIAMDFWASVEHQLRYKKDNEFTSQMAEELLNCAQISADLDSRMGKLKKMIEK